MLPTPPRMVTEEQAFSPIVVFVPSSTSYFFPCTSPGVLLGRIFYTSIFVVLYLILMSHCVIVKCVERCCVGDVSRDDV